MSEPEITVRKEPPFICPVCYGRGEVDRGLYERASTNASPMTCRTCGGVGIVWRPQP